MNYVGLWIELSELCECNFRYVILNLMWRIIEIFVKFNNLNIDDFYWENVIYKKFFDVGFYFIDDLIYE